MNLDRSVTCIAPINIAVIKYWGKSNEDYNIPLNSSISVTINLNDLCARTTISTCKDYKKDTLTLNGKNFKIEDNERLLRCLKKVRKSTDSFCSIISSNNFPTAAGLASSAAGYACLAKCLGTIYSYDDDLSILARLGSGSASRSIYGGFVKWEKGSSSDGTDSKAIQIADQMHWPELKVIILVVSSKEKSIGSTKGMKLSVETSDFLKYRAEIIVPERIKLMEKAILEKDFEKFAEITMKESNQLHAICQDTYPPISPPYMNQTSHHIVELITKYNAKQLKAAYTFDAGANAVIFTLDRTFEELVGTISKYFPCPKSSMNIDNEQIMSYERKAMDIPDFVMKENAITRMVLTKPGPGAMIVDD